MAISSIAPISPEDAKKHHSVNIPNWVIEFINEKLIKGAFNGIVKIQQGEILAARPIDVSSKEVFENYWLDFEDLYRAVGWNVTYDKPGYNESYEAFFIFHSKSK